MTRTWTTAATSPLHFSHTASGRKAALEARQKHGGWVVSQDECYWWTNVVGEAERLVLPLVEGDQEAAKRVIGHPASQGPVLDAQTAKRLARYVCVGECPKDQDGCPDLCTGRKMEPGPPLVGKVSDFLIKTRIGHGRMNAHSASALLTLIEMGEGGPTLRIDGYRDGRGKLVLTLHYPREGCIPKLSKTDNVITLETP
jgi:hypothetical protein